MPWTDLAKLQICFQYQIRLSKATSSDPTVVGPATSGSKSASPIFTYNGEVHHASVADADVVKSGKYLRLSDAQVRQLTRGKTLFEYSISVSLCRNENGAEQTIPLHPKSQKSVAATMTSSAAPETSKSEDSSTS